MYDTDRRRLLLAIVVTLMALPAFWYAGRHTAPAAAERAGAVAETTIVTTTEPPPPTVGEPNLPPPEPVEDAPVFLDGPAGQISEIPAIAVPGQPSSERFTGEATYRRALGGANVCLSRTSSSNRPVTVVNLDNNRATTCQLVRAPDTQQIELVMDVDRFEDIADLTDAPIPVEVRL